ncbi:hypothetical protein CFP56_005989 [Quercus suber]|uniref:Uncharacterized protein n=1 Tax=Quercus suber TaxID=58331 RepID=A0AAW0M8H5_QUESU
MHYNLQGNIPWTFGNLSIEILHLLNNMLLGEIHNEKKKGSQGTLTCQGWSGYRLTGENLVAMITLKESSHPDCHT